MAGRRSGRMPALSSPLTLLDKVAPAHRALTAEMAGLAIDGAHYQALARTVDALGVLARDLGHPDRFAAAPSSTVPPGSGCGENFRNRGGHDDAE